MDSTCAVEKWVGGKGGERSERMSASAGEAKEKTGMGGGGLWIIDGERLKALNPNR